MEEIIKEMELMGHCNVQVEQTELDENKLIKCSGMQLMISQKVQKRDTTAGR